MSALASYLGLSLDSFVVCFVGAPLLRGRRFGVAVLFGVFDALATLAVGLGASGAVAFFVLALLLLVVALIRPGWGRLSALPLLMSIDNLATPRAPIDALPAGLMSFALAWLGFIVCDLLLMRFVPVSRRRHAGLAMAGLYVAARFLA